LSEINMFIDGKETLRRIAKIKNSTG